MLKSRGCKECKRERGKRERGKKVKRSEIILAGVLRQITFKVALTENSVCLLMRGRIPAIKRVSMAYLLVCYLLRQKKEIERERERKNDRIMARKQANRYRGIFICYADWPIVCSVWQFALQVLTQSMFITRILFYIFYTLSILCLFYTIYYSLFLFYYSVLFCNIIIYRPV